MEIFVEIVNGFQPLIIFAKTSILDVWQGIEYASATSNSVSLFLALETFRTFIFSYIVQFENF